MKNELTEKLIKEVKKAVKGKEEVIRKVAMAIFASGHVLLEDVPGLGKTTLALAFSDALGLDNKRIQFTPDTMPSDIIGCSIFNEKDGEFSYMPGAVMTNLLLGDEINRTSPKTQSALLEAMAEGKVTVDGIRYDLPSPFIIMATQNPISSGGTQPLPDSQLDRFMVKLSMGYPDKEAQVEMLQQYNGADSKNKVQQVMTVQEVVMARKEVHEIHVSEEMLRYITELCEMTRQHEDILQGISVRGMIAFMQMAKANAYFTGRKFVIPEDVQAIFVDSCAHRLILNSHARRDGKTGASILRDIMELVVPPRLLSA